MGRQGKRISCVSEKQDNPSRTECKEEKKVKFSWEQDIKLMTMCQDDRLAKAPFWFTEDAFFLWTGMNTC